MSSHYQKAYFLLSAADVKQLPPDQGMEVAIVGRSNAGKSSVLNQITRNKSLARVSKTPGRTQHLNIFVLDEQRRLVDLPGYGYAKAPLAAKRKWEQTVDTYVRTRASLKGMLLIMDIRHPMKELDVQLLDYCGHANLPVHVLLNKADKLSRQAALKVGRDMATTCAARDQAITVQLFSASNGTGTKELYVVLDKWYIWS